MELKGIILSVAILAVRLQCSEDFLNKMNGNSLNQTPKVWHQYLETMASKSLQKLSTMNQRKALASYKYFLSRFIRMARHFVNYANRDASPWVGLMGRGPPETQSSGQIYLPHLKIGTFPQHWFFFKFSVVKLLTVKLHIFTMNIGITTTKNCRSGAGYKLEVFTKYHWCYTYVDSNIFNHPFTYCGQLSKFSVFSRHNFMCLKFGLRLLSWGSDNFHGMFQVFDSKVLFTSSDKRSSNVYFSSHYVFLALNDSLFVASIDVAKFKHILLKAQKNMHGHNISVFDGPGFDSSRIELSSGAVVSTTSFHCLILILGSSDTIVSYESELQPQSDINLTQSVSMTWPSNSHAAERQFVANIYNFHVEKDKRMVANVVNFTIKGKNNTHCAFCGVAVFEAGTEILSYCTPPENAFQPQNTVYSRTEALLVVMYFHQLYCKLSVRVDIGETNCSSVRLNLSTWLGCTAQSNIQRCNRKLKTVSKFSNISLAFKNEHSRTLRSLHQLFFSLPSGQCGVIHIKNPKVRSWSPFHCVTLSPQPLNLNNLKIPSTSIFYYVTGSLKTQKEDTKPNSLKFLGSFENFTCNVTFKMCPLCRLKTDNCTESKNTTAKKNQTYLPPNTEAHFHFHAIGKQDIGSEQGQIYVHMMQGGPSWILVVLSNSSEKISAQIVAVSSSLNHLGELRSIPQKPDLAFQVICQKTQTRMTIFSLLKEKILSQRDRFVNLCLKWQASCSPKTDLMIFLPGVINTVVLHPKTTTNLFIRWYWDPLRTTMRVSSVNQPILVTLEKHKAHFTAKHSFGASIKITNYTLISYQKGERWSDRKPTKYYNWNETQTLCTEMENTLPVIRNQREQIEIVSLMKLSPAFVPSEVLFIAHKREVIFLHCCFSWGGLCSSTVAVLLCVVGWVVVLKIDSDCEQGRRTTNINAFKLDLQFRDGHHCPLGKQVYLQSPSAVEPQTKFWVHRCYAPKMHQKSQMSLNPHLREAIEYTKNSSMELMVI